MKIYRYPTIDQYESLTQRPTINFSELEQTISSIFDEVKKTGDRALRCYTKQFDKVELDSLLVTEQEFDEANKLVSKELKKAIKLAKQNIFNFHNSETYNRERISTMNGVECWRKYTPIQKVGLYIPGGSANLFSTVLMLAIPAKIAGCEEISICSPPNQNGEIAPAVLYAAQLVGVKQIYKIGGAQAVAAMCLGTESIPQVSKIYGPGNQYVTAAKQFAFCYGVAIDMPAGPSELLIMADKTAKPSFVASDLLSQAEHGTDSQVIVLTTEPGFIPQLELELAKQLASLPRKEIASQALKNSKIILLKDCDQMLQFSNVYAPEHLIISTQNEDKVAEKVMNAGSVFLGNFSPESAGDYASGTNHSLPTNGAAKAYSGVTTLSFMKQISFQKISPKGLQNIGKSIELMAEAEGLQAHKNAVSLRLESLKMNTDA